MYSLVQELDLLFQHNTHPKKEAPTSRTNNNYAYKKKKRKEIHQAKAPLQIKIDKSIFSHP